MFGKPKGAARLGDPEACFLGRAPGLKMLCAAGVAHINTGAQRRELYPVDVPLSTGAKQAIGLESGGGIICMTFGGSVS